MSDESHFYLGDFVNKQNCQIRDSENPREKKASLSLTSSSTAQSRFETSKMEFEDICRLATLRFGYRTFHEKDIVLCV